MTTAGRAAARPAASFFLDLRPAGERRGTHNVSAPAARRRLPGRRVPLEGAPGATRAVDRAQPLAASEHATCAMTDDRAVFPTAAPAGPAPSARPIAAGAAVEIGPVRFRELRAVA